MSAAADTEDKTEKKSGNTRRPEACARLLWRDVASRGMANEALAAFEATLKKSPTGWRPWVPRGRRKVWRRSRPGRIIKKWSLSPVPPTVPARKLPMREIAW